MSSAAVRVAVALSGGVDSAVAALFLRRCVRRWRDVEALWHTQRPLTLHEVHEALEQQRPWSDVVAYTPPGGTNHDLLAAIQYFPVFMKNWEDVAEDGGHGDRSWCEAAQQDYNDATDVARAVGLLQNGETLPLHNYSACYVEKCFEPMLAAYARGETLNVDVLCNEEVKFYALLNTLLATGKAQYLATGHYARTLHPPVFSCSNTTPAVGQVIARPFSSRKDLNDQTVFLSRLSRMQALRAIFPLGHVFEQKTDVRAVADRFGLTRVSRKKTSTGLCFVGERYKRVSCGGSRNNNRGGNDGGFERFLEEYIAPGSRDLQKLLEAGGKTTFVDAGTGNIIQASNLRLMDDCRVPILPAYKLTIGQKIYGESANRQLRRFYVQRKELFPLHEVKEDDSARYLQTVWLVDRWDHPLLFETLTELRDVMLSLHPRFFGQQTEELRLPCRCCARHQEPLRPAILSFAWGDVSESDGAVRVSRATVVFDEPIRALTAGQAVVAYMPFAEKGAGDAAGWFVLASGWIA